MRGGIVGRCGPSRREALGLVAATFVVTLLVPSSVEAAGSALTRITDGKGPVAKVDASGKLAVAAPPSAASRPWMNVNGTSVNGANPSEVLYSGVVKDQLNLTTFSVSSAPGTAGSVTLHAQVLVGDPGDSCDDLSGGSFGAAERFTIVVPVGGTVVETFPSPLTWSQYGEGNDPFCVQVSGSGPSGWTAYILANGFLG